MAIAVCSADELPSGSLKCVTVEGEKYMLYHLDDGFFATQHRCPHMLKSLSSAKIIEGDKVRCSLHHATFDIKTGQVVHWANFPPGIQLANVVRPEKALQTYKVSVVDGMVMLEV